MAYSYEIRFSTGAYAELLPSNQIELVGGWEVGTMIWREKIGEVKIGRLKNATIYDTLESWFDDDTKFATRINIRILKDSVEESVHWFGIKWGTINEYQKTYTITPIPYDLWAQYFESNKDRIYNVESGGSSDFLFYETAGNLAYIDEVINGERLMQTIKDLVFQTCDSWPKADSISSFINQDNYEDASAVGTYRGMPLDYVTGEQSYMTGAGTKYNRDLTFSKLLQWLLLFRTYVYFDSNDKLRFEHIKFFNDKLTDNAVDYSSLMKVSDERFSYIDPLIPVLELLEMSTESDDDDSDFISSEILYSDIRNRPDAQPIDHSFDLNSNLAYYGTGTLAVSLLVWGAHENSIYKFANGDASSFTSDYNTFVVTYTTGQYWGTSDFRVALNGDDFIISVFVSAISGSFDVYIVDRSSSATISNTMNVNSTGLNSITFTTTAAADDAYIRFEATANGSATSTYATLTKDNSTEYTIPSVEAIESSSVKTNAELTTGNNIDKWWRDDRYAREATFNSTGYAATSTVFNLARDTINIYYKGSVSGVSRWFLPSLDELEQMDVNLRQYGVGGFATTLYWSSSERDNTTAHNYFLSDPPSASWTDKFATLTVRACRTFTDSVGAYSLRDEGPAGGLIFYISGTTYYEAAQADQSASQAWSNVTATAVTGTGTAIGTGEANTTAIINQVGHIASAAKLCDDLAVGMGGEINPLFGWNDGTRIAKIDKWTRNLKTGYYKIDLTYQEDD